MHVAYFGWGGQQQQVLLPSLVACTNLTDTTRCVLPSACQRRAPSFIRATSCRAETPTQQTAIGLAEPSTVFAVSSERSGTPERAAKRPLEVQLQPASPAETLIQPQWPVRYRSEPSNGSPQPPDRRPPRGQGAPPAAAQKQQKQRSGGKSRQGGGWMARRRNLARNVELVASKNAEEVLVIVEEQLDAFNDVNAVTAFHRLARVCIRTLLIALPVNFLLVDPALAALHHACLGAVRVRVMQRSSAQKTLRSVQCILTTMAPMITTACHRRRAEHLQKVISQLSSMHSRIPVMTIWSVS